MAVFSNACARPIHPSVPTLSERLYGESLIVEKVPQLVLNEVLAIRLYTGPGYTPINTFLREVAKLGPDWRKRIAHMHQLSYSATVAHLTAGLRKLVKVYGNEGVAGAVGAAGSVAVEAVEAAAAAATGGATASDFHTVFRGVRGELPEAFWLKDDFG